MKVNFKGGLVLEGMLNWNWKGSGVWVQSVMGMG